MKLLVSKSDRRRVQITPSREAALLPHEEIEIAVDVIRPDYVPDGVELRMRLTDQMFTGVTRAETLEQLEHDPQVKNVQVGRTLRIPTMGS